MKIPKRRISAVLFFLALLSLSLALTQTQDKSQEILQHEVTVTLKLVQAHVTDKKGNPVTDLEKSDFILYDNGKLKKITEFERHSSSLSETDPQKKESQIEIATNSEKTFKKNQQMGRRFLLFFNFALMRPGAILKARKVGLYFIDYQLRRDDEVGVMSYDIYRGPNLHEYFTTEHKKVREVVESFGIKEARGRAQNLMRDYWSEYQAARIGLQANRDAYEAQVKVFTKQLLDVARALRYIPGIKHMIYFSEGVYNFMYTGITGNEATRYELGSKSSVLRDFYESMSEELAASNCHVYPINTGGRRGDISLRHMANISGGKYFDNVVYYEDITEKVQNITKDFYVLGYYIDEKWDGKYHRIKVKVKRKGCQVFGQRGYFNPKPFSEYTKMEKMLHLIDLALSEKPLLQEPYHFPLIAIPFAQVQKANCVTVTRIPAEKIKDISGAQMEAVTLFFDKDNNIADMHKSETGSSSLTQDNVYFTSFSSLAPGDYDCRVVIRNMDTGQGAVAASSVVIPETPDSGLVLYPPLLLVENGNASYINGTEKNKKYVEISLSDIYPFDSNLYVPLVKDLEGSLTRIHAVMGCSMMGIQQPDIKLSAKLIHHLDDTRKTIPTTISILNRYQDEYKDVFFVALHTHGLQSGEYSLHLTMEDRHTQSHSSTITTLKVK